MNAINFVSLTIKDPNVNKFKSSEDVLTQLLFDYSNFNDALSWGASCKEFRSRRFVPIYKQNQTFLLKNLSEALHRVLNCRFPQNYTQKLDGNLLKELFLEFDEASTFGQLIKTIEQLQAKMFNSVDESTTKQQEREELYRLLTGRNDFEKSHLGLSCYKWNQFIFNGKFFPFPLFFNENILLLNNSPPISLKRVAYYLTFEICPIAKNAFIFNKKALALSKKKRELILDTIISLIDQGKSNIAMMLLKKIIHLVPTDGLFFSSAADALNKQEKGLKNKLDRFEEFANICNRDGIDPRFHFDKVLLSHKARIFIETNSLEQSEDILDKLIVARREFEQADCKLGTVNSIMGVTLLHAAKLFTKSNELEKVCYYFHYGTISFFRKTRYYSDTPYFTDELNSFLFNSLEDFGKFLARFALPEVTKSIRCYNDFCHLFFHSSLFSYYSKMSMVKEANDILTILKRKFGVEKTIGHETHLFLTKLCLSHKEIEGAIYFFNRANIWDKSIGEDLVSSLTKEKSTSANCKILSIVTNYRDIIGLSVALNAAKKGNWLKASQIFDGILLSISEKLVNSKLYVKPENFKLIQSIFMQIAIAKIREDEKKENIISHLNSLLKYTIITKTYQTLANDTVEEINLKQILEIID